MRFVKGLKKGFRYVLLSLCLLGVVFQPVNIFANSSSDPYILVNGQIFKIGTTIYSVTVYNVYDANNFDLIDSIKSYYSLSSSDIYFAWQGTNYAYIVPVSSSFTPSVNIPTGQFTVGNIYYSDDNTTYSLSEYYRLSSNGTYEHITNNSNSVSIAGSSNTLFYFNSPLVYISGSYYTFNSGSSIDTYLANLYLQNGLLISNNFRSYTPDGTLVNGSWLGVGAFLTYQYNCMQNMNSASVTYINQAGSIITASNPYYYFYHQLDSIFADISDIMIAVEDLGDTVTYLSDINNKLNAAFPSNQAAINDFIAEDVMDDTDGKGLTISKIASTKSLLDEGVDTFEVDSSGITWSNPFSALLHLDWAWFSETTALNLQAQDQASLLNDIDYSDLQYYNSVNSYYDDGH